jgi:tetratricopeptide (TPR) repeat protein
MSTRSPSPRVVGGLLALALMAGATSTSTAQQSPLRPGQSPGPRFVMSALQGLGDGPRLGFQVANAVRERIASDYDMRALWVVPESTITEYLIKAGYPAEQTLSSAETRQLASDFRAEEVLKGIVRKTPTGYQVQAAWSLSGRDDMVQPLPAVEATKISDVAKLVAREFQAARKQVESVQRCVNLARARNYAGALAEAHKAIEAYPQSVLGRVCIANIYDQQKLGPDSMLRISSEILSIHPENARALAFAADAYQTKGLIDDQIRMLTRLVVAEPSNRHARLALVNRLASLKDWDAAGPLIDSTVQLFPTDVEAVTTQWRIQLATKQWRRALDTGRRLVSLDTSLATHDLYIRMIGAAEGAQDLPLALDLATEAVGRFPTDDELVVLRVQYLRRNGQLRQALAVVNSLVARNPRVPNAWVQKALVEADLGLGPDTLLATLTRGLENGEVRTSVAQFARSLGQAASKDTVAANRLSSPRAAIRFFRLADSAQATDTTALLLGNEDVTLARNLATEPPAAKRCELAKELTDVTADAQIVLPRAGRGFGDTVATLLRLADQLGTYGAQLMKATCQRKD